ncbi:cation-translocating P-type ATPase [Psychroflexus sediminis]|uniref:Ca2+-transporting ATPase n=1 Tax=Psychroflexus sediminis TaxID=470826 RepID=A0A1G7XDT0_9FLAO|nr:HAD-IC family P-type ATPase [Psychroflexus sediminis]SDG81730.1 Ca2+-transporting ATPase [Psychroflexus sediminis]
MSSTYNSGNTSQHDKSEETGKTNSYTKGTDEVVEEHSVDPEKGLSEDEVTKSRDKHGKNVLPQKGKTSPLKIFIKQFKDFLILILFIAAGISFYASQAVNGYIILGVILFNAIMGFFQEYRAEKAVESIKSMVKHKITVLRGGEQATISSKKVVVGDIIILNEGESIPADARLLEVKNLRTDESSLTGESEPVEKVADKKLKKDTAIADQKNMVWKGTHIVKGSGKAVVVSVGGDTEIGKIAKSLQEMKTGESNFRKKTARLTKKMAGIAVFTSIIVFCVGYFYRAFEFQEILLVTIATMVSSIPEGLPVVISIVFAIGAKRMAKQNAIIREFTATEVLGSVSTILTDKTGTLTQSILSVKHIFGADEKEYQVEGQGHEIEGEIKNQDKTVDVKEAPEVLKKILFIVNYGTKAKIQNKQEEEEDADEDKNGSDDIKVTGDPTEAALKVLGKKSGIDELEAYSKPEELDDLPFNSRQKFRAKLVQFEDGKKEILVAGAPERVMELSSKVLTGEGVEDLDEDTKEVIQKKNEDWADQALRVIGLAHKEVSKDEIENEDVKDLVWTGIVGLIDPPRPEVNDAIGSCKRAGIRVMMLTGDHAKTAAAIAKKVGITNENENEDSDYPSAVSGSEVNDAQEEDLDGMIRNVSVFARMNPNTKLLIAERLQQQGELIAMTGDGVNDAPALKKADVGIAMGQRGTDVAKDAAQIVLSDDNFSSIVKAIREGRIVFKNVKSTSYFLLTTNFAGTSVLIFGLLLGFPLPLTAVQILWINMVTDGIMDVAKSTEKGHGDMMDRDPIRKDEPILTWEIMPFLLIMAAIMVSMTLYTFSYYESQGTEMARTGAFFVVAMTQVFNAFNMRDLNKSVFDIGLLSNKWINLAFITSIVLQLAVVKIPFLQDVFGFDNIPYLDFFIMVLASSVVLWAGELYKWIKRK